MDLKEKERILRVTDHTVLSPTATPADIKSAALEAYKHNCASVCVPPCYVEDARRYLDMACLEGQYVPVATVIGFPFGFADVRAKSKEAEYAKLSGADEIDCVLNLGTISSCSYQYSVGTCYAERKLKNEIEALINAVDFDENTAIKFIIEAELWDDDKKLLICDVMNGQLAGYPQKSFFVKTSTGLNSGATVHDVELLRKNLDKNIKIKASGGIRTFESAKELIDAGADRIGASRLVSLLEEKNNGN